jgi:hypothetical protein
MNIPLSKEEQEYTVRKLLMQRIKLVSMLKFGHPVILFKIRNLKLRHYLGEDLTEYIQA